MPHVNIIKASGRCHLAVLLLLAFPLPANAAMTCERAAEQAADETGVPLDVLRAITLVETGRRVDGMLAPWPWALNSNGESHWFDDRGDLIEAASTLIAAGERNMDIGCFQLNLRWHHQGFASLEAMVDPLQNAIYAATFLRQLFGETGDWSDAAAAYHSRTPAPAESYRQRFEAVLAGLNPPSHNEPQFQEDGTSFARITRVNAYPLLQGGSTQHGGSVVPLSGLASPLIGGP